jgi:hypothetical protein
MAVTALYVLDFSHPSNDKGMNTPLIPQAKYRTPALF